MCGTSLLFLAFVFEEEIIRKLVQHSLRNVSLLSTTRSPSLLRVLAQHTTIRTAERLSSQTVYTMMLTDQKESLHEVCAQWHEEHNKGNASYQSVIMHHWMRSSNTPKKVHSNISRDVALS